MYLKLCKGQIACLEKGLVTMFDLLSHSVADIHWNRNFLINHK